MTATLAKVEPTQLTIGGTQPIFTDAQEQLIRDVFIGGASKQEAAVLLEVARTRRLNPLLKQIHFVKRWDSQKQKEVWASQVSIDGLRAIAERTGKYDGQDEAEFGPISQRGYPEWARVRVYRKDWSRPAVGTAYWDEYVQTKKGGEVTRFWSTMPRVMLAKCAESIAMRKAFPEDMSGLYTPEEMGQSENDRPPQISPHEDDSDDGSRHDPGVAADLLRRCEVAKALIPIVDSYEKALELRALLGSKAKQSELTRDIQRARESQELSPDQYKELGKIWQHCDRQCAKLEAQLKTDAADAFTDPAEEFERT